MTILINSPDSYSDVFSVFLQCKEKNWRNCRYELVLSTNTKEYKGLTVLHSGGKSGNSWMDREILALNFINTKYIMIMCEDSLIMSQVEESLLENILDDMDNYGINYCKLFYKFISFIKIAAAPFFCAAIVCRIAERNNKGKKTVFW